MSKMLNSLCGLDYAWGKNVRTYEGHQTTFSNLFEAAFFLNIALSEICKYPSSVIFHTDIRTVETVSQIVYEETQTSQVSPSEYWKTFGSRNINADFFR